MPNNKPERYKPTNRRRDTAGYKEPVDDFNAILVRRACDAFFMRRGMKPPTIEQIYIGFDVDDYADKPIANEKPKGPLKAKD